VSPKATRRERVEWACLFLRRGERREETGQTLEAFPLDAPDLEITPDPQKVLRFFDPVVTSAWERICWERAIAVLAPLSNSQSQVQQALGVHYTALSLFNLGAEAQSGEWLARPGVSSPDQDTAAVGRLLLAAISWRAKPPTPATLDGLWQATEVSPEAVLLWDALRLRRPLELKPLEARLAARLQQLPDSLSGRRHGSLIGRWGLSRLAAGDDSRAVLARLSPFRDHANKNKLESNDPLLLLAIAACNYRNAEYAQALETLFELAKTLPGLRGLQWNLQGIYAARQKAGGEARISQ
jgi:hypothetical protein